MAAAGKTALSEIVAKYESELLAEWVDAQLAATGLRRDLMRDEDLREQSRRFLQLFARRAPQTRLARRERRRRGTRCASSSHEISRSRARSGLQPERDRDLRLLAQAAALRAAARASSAATPRRSPTRSGARPSLLDKLGLYTTEVYQKSREEVIARQQQEMLELSTPVVQLWEGILALPLIGTLDSARTQVVMESLLQTIVETGAGHRDHRHHRRADRRHAGRPAPAQDGRRGAADGRRLHHQRHPAADRADDRAPRRRPERRHHQGDARRRVRARARARLGLAVAPRRGALSADGAHPDPQDGRLPAGHASRSTCTTGWR